MNTLRFYKLACWTLVCSFTLSGIALPAYSSPGSETIELMGVASHSSDSNQNIEVLPAPVAPTAPPALDPDAPLDPQAQQAALERAEFAASERALEAQEQRQTDESRLRRLKWATIVSGGLLVGSLVTAATAVALTLHYNTLNSVPDNNSAYLASIALGALGGMGSLVALPGALWMGRDYYRLNKYLNPPLSPGEAQAKKFPWDKTPELHVKMSPTHAQAQQDPCTVCLEELDKAVDSEGKPLGAAVLLKCKHAFHSNCIEQWYTNGVNPGTCPNCRELVSKLSEKERQTLIARFGVEALGEEVAPAAEAAVSDSSHEHAIYIRDEATGEVSEVPTQVSSATSATQ